jgi:hypothetical protein
MSAAQAAGTHCALSASFVGTTAQRVSFELGVLALWLGSECCRESPIRNGLRANQKARCGKSRPLYLLACVVWLLDMFVSELILRLPCRSVTSWNSPTLNIRPNVFTLNENDKVPTVLLGRRSFVAGSVALGVILAWRFTERNRPLHAEVESAGLPKSVTIIEFTDEGQRISTVTVDRIVKTEAEWKR